MFVIDDKPTFKTVATIMTPVDGGHREESLDVTYEVIDSDEEAKFKTDSIKGQIEHLKRIVRHVDGLQSKDGGKVTYSDELRDKLLKLPHVRLGLMRGYNAAILKAKEGN